MKKSIAYLLCMCLFINLLNGITVFSESNDSEIVIAENGSGKKKSKKVQTYNKEIIDNTRYL